MIAKVLRDRGGLHNRVTRRMQLHPFSLYETEQFLISRGMQLNRRQILELTMAVGGIPYYLDYVRKGPSAAQNIDAMFFSPRAPLHDEFENLYAALFEHHERHLHGAGQWMHLHSTPAWQAWSGYAFENLCLRHVPQIKHASSIGGVRAGISAWRHQSTGAGDAAVWRVMALFLN